MSIPIEPGRLDRLVKKLKKNSCRWETAKYYDSTIPVWSIRWKPDRSFEVVKEQDSFQYLRGYDALMSNLTPQEQCRVQNFDELPLPMQFFVGAEGSISEMEYYHSVTIGKTVDGDTYKLTKSIKETYPCKSLAECVQLLPEDIIDKLEKSNCYIYKGKTIEWRHDEIFFCNSYGDTSRVNFAPETGTLLNIITELQGEIDDLKATFQNELNDIKDLLGYLPNGAKYQEAQTRFSSLSSS